MTRTGEDFRRQAHQLAIIRWPLRNCSICGYELAYLFDGDLVAFDGGCDCGPYHYIEQRSWDVIAERYNMQINLDVIARYDRFWGFGRSREPGER